MQSKRLSMGLLISNFRPVVIRELKKNPTAVTYCFLTIFFMVNSAFVFQNRQSGRPVQYLEYLPSNSANQLIKHNYFTLSYNEKYEQAEWVAYELKKIYVKSNSFNRPYFIEDPKVNTGSAHWQNYKHSGYDKGHLCPAGDMEFDINAYNDTFYTSNISPQNHDFNAGIWNRLEQKVRYWATKYDGVFVITGGVLQPNLKTIGQDKVLVPNHFYKILFKISQGNCKMVAFLIPNAKSNRPLHEFVVPVDKIEQMTGIDFFAKLDDKIESKLEQSNDYKEWAFK